MSEGQDQKENATPNSRKLWTAGEDEELRTEFQAGWRLADIASKHGRSVAGVRKRLERLRLVKEEK